MTSLAVEGRGLRKSFGDHVLLDGIDLAFAEGSIFALTGPGNPVTGLRHSLPTSDLKILRLPEVRDALLTG